MGLKKAATDVRDGAVKGAPRELLEDLFQDFYRQRYKLYWMNLIRGIFFGFGSVIGGTLFVALLLWILGLLHEVPFVDGFVESVQHSIEAGQRR